MNPYEFVDPQLESQKARALHKHLQNRSWLVLDVFRADCHFKDASDTDKHWTALNAGSEADVAGPMSSQPWLFCMGQRCFQSCMP